MKTASIRSSTRRAILDLFEAELKKTPPSATQFIREVIPKLARERNPLIALFSVLASCSELASLYKGNDGILASKLLGNAIATFFEEYADKNNVTQETFNLLMFYLQNVPENLLPHYGLFVGCSYISRILGRYKRHDFSLEIFLRVATSEMEDGIKRKTLEWITVGMSHEVASLTEAQEKKKKKAERKK